MRKSRTGSGARAENGQKWIETVREVAPKDMFRMWQLMYRERAALKRQQSGEEGRREPFSFQSLY